MSSLTAKSPFLIVISMPINIACRLLVGTRKLSVFLLNQLNFIRLRYIDFDPRPDDIFIVTYPRSGTTWTQMILYQLTTDGNMDFTHISEHIPWFERKASNGGDLRSVPPPRVIKTHLSYRWIPKGPGKYIYIARNGKDVAVSMFNMYKSHYGYKGTFPEFFDRFMRGKVVYGSWFKHVAEWWSHRNDDNVLFLSYEDLSANLDGCIRKIIDFCGLEVPEERIPEILYRCSFEFMKENESKFDHITQLLLEWGLVEKSFIRKGKVGKWADVLDSQQEEAFDREYERVLGDTGIDLDRKGRRAVPAGAAGR